MMEDYLREREEQEKLAQKLQDLQENKVLPGNLYSILWNLGKAEYMPARPVIETFLTYPDDVEVRIAALQILVGRFGARERKYWEMARDMLTDPNSKTEGALLLGDLKSNTQDEETLRLLAPLVSNAKESHLARRSAYAAMREVLHFDPFEFGKIAMFRDFNLEQEVDWELVKKYGG